MEPCTWPKLITTIAEKMNSKTLIICLLTYVLAGLASAQLQPNSTNPVQLALRDQDDLFETTYWYFEWEVEGYDSGAKRELHLNSWYNDYGNIYYYDTPLVITAYSGSGVPKLQFDGKIEAEEVEVKNLSLPDYVFEESYDLKPLAEVEQYIQAHKHLPGVPSAEYVAENGMNMTEMTNVMLQKIEELTLHVIELEKKNEALESQVSALVK